MIYYLPIICSFLFHFGGQDQWPWCPINQKLWRWLMGIPIAYTYGCIYRSVIPALCILTYFIATNVSSYGINHPFRKWFGRDGAWLVYGFIFGLAALPIMGWWAFAQAGLNMGIFWGLMKWSNDGISGHKLSHKFVELSFGLIGTIGYIFFK